MNEKNRTTLKMDNLNTDLIREINMSGLQIGEIYYVLKSIFKEIEMLYTKQAEAEYKEFCDEVKKEQENVQEKEEEEKE